MLEVHHRWVVACGMALGLAACSGDEAAPDRSPDRSANQIQPGDDQTPPQGAASVEAWLAKGSYKTWQCEADVHESRSPSPHGYNRICSNDLIAADAQGQGAWPKGAAAVKELHATADAKEPIGFAVYLKTTAESDGGDNWYWYERVPLDSAAPHDANGVVADGLGDQGPEKAICVSCHVAAGSDQAHTPSLGARDQVYTPVE